MLYRLRRLFQRFSARHLCLRVTVSKLPVSKHLRIHSLLLEHNYLKAEGTSEADQVSLTLAGMRRTTRPETYGKKVGHFALTLPYGPGMGRVEADWGDADIAVEALEIPPISSVKLALGRALLWPKFMLAILQAMPAARRWFRDKDPAARVTVRNILGLAPLTDAGRLEAGLLRAQPRPTPTIPKASITILMPVYNAFEVLGEALERIPRNTDLPWHLILLEDGSTDARVRPFLRAWANKMKQEGHVVTLLENPTNLGFIGTVNRGLKLVLESMDDPGVLVLLNSDALVPKGWASRLVAPILADLWVASVTPMSNDAELNCIPHPSQRSDLAPGVADLIDNVARTLNVPLEGIGDMPTGVGFCMAMSLRFLRLEPQLDPIFGPGYGEEVDWCQKTIKHGGRHVAQPGLFIEHRGGASFGTAQKQQLLHKNSAILSRRYPEFDQQVQDFLTDDVLLTTRLVLGVAKLAAEAALHQPIPVYLGHNMGGGAEMYLMRRVRDDVARLGGALVIRVGADLRWLVELHSSGGVTRGLTGDTDFLIRLMAFLPCRRVIYSCGVGDTDPGGLPDILRRLGDAESGGWEVLFHDFLPLSPSYTLLNSDGCYHGLPSPEQNDAAHNSRRSDGVIMDLSAWRIAWGRLMAQADTLEVFSESSRKLVAEAFPQHAGKIVVTPHQMLHQVAPVTPPAQLNKGPVIGVLGNIGTHKGAGILVQLSRMLARNRQAKLVVIGDLDPAYRLARPALVHGKYTPADLPVLVQRYRINYWLIPSIWPETFSFTTHEAIATGLPVFAFDLGAQGDLVAKQGTVIPLIDGQPDLRFLLELIGQMSHMNVDD